MMNLQKILAQAQQALTRALGQNLEALLVYGSAAVGDYDPKSSDLNLLAILKTVDLESLDLVRRFMKSMGKFRVAAPLLMTREHIRTSTDVFPIEFLEIKEKHRMLLGEDPFTGLDINTRNLRHECEHELKGRLIRLRQSYLEIRDQGRDLKTLLVSAHSANFPAFRTSLRLKQVSPPVKKEAITAALAGNFSLDQELFIKMKLLRLGELKLTPSGLCSLMEKYLIEVEKLAQAVDSL